MEYTLADEIDAVTVEGYDMAIKPCPHEECDGKIDTAKQAEVTGGGIFICPSCDRRLYIKVDGTLATEEEYAVDQISQCEK